VSGSVVHPTAYDVSPERWRPAQDDGAVSLRKLPYPYQAALAICSDIDGTETTEEFLEIQRFLNTKKITSMGEGVGLEIGNSFYFYDSGDGFSYFGSDDRARGVITDLIRAGYVDCLHTYGDGATNRSQILRALEALYTADCRLDVWVNHYGAPSNLGRKFEYALGECRGDDPSSSVYHADVTLAYGIRFVWTGAHTCVIGQSPAVKPWYSLATVFDPRFPLRSLGCTAREIGKRAFGACRDERFIIHRLNRLSRVMRLEDGQKVHEFVRYCNHPRGVSQGATSRGLAHAISRRALECLNAVGGFAIVYTHLGKNEGCRQVIAPETQVALRNLEREVREGRIYVTTTSRLLNYYQACMNLVWSYERRQDGWIWITIDQLDDLVLGRSQPTARQLQGLTFYVPDRERADVTVRGVALQGLQRNPADDSGVESVTIPLTHLSFPC
jgi:hypothetical protein